MKKVFLGFLSLSMVALFSVSAWSWGHANRYGGGSWHGFGATGHENAWGGSTSHTFGEGTTHTNAWGGSASHYAGGGWSKTGAYGGTAYGDAHYGGAYYHPPGGAYYPAYHPPATVNYYGAGCYNCGGWATAGAAATSSACSAGVAAGSAAGSNYLMGAIYATLPAGCVMPSVQGSTYYLCGNTWFRPSYGANGVYYTVVPAP